MTNIDDLRFEVGKIYPLFLMGIVIDGIRGTLRGPIYALGLMKIQMKWNILFQCFLMPMLIYYFIIVKKMGLEGTWYAKLICDFLNTSFFVITLATANWYKIAYDFMKNRTNDSGVYIPELQNKVNKNEFQK